MAAAQFRTRVSEFISRLATPDPGPHVTHNGNGGGYQATNNKYNRSQHNHESNISNHAKPSSSSKTSSSSNRSRHQRRSSHPERFVAPDDPLIKSYPAPKSTATRKPSDVGKGEKLDRARHLSSDTSTKSSKSPITSTTSSNGTTSSSNGAVRQHGRRGSHGAGFPARSSPQDYSSSSSSSESSSTKQQLTVRQEPKIRDLIQSNHSSPSKPSNSSSHNSRQAPLSRNERVERKQRQPLPPIPPLATNGGTDKKASSGRMNGSQQPLPLQPPPLKLPSSPRRVTVQRSQSNRVNPIRSVFPSGGVAAAADFVRERFQKLKASSHLPGSPVKEKPHHHQSGHSTSNGFVTAAKQPQNKQPQNHNSEDGSFIDQYLCGNLVRNQPDVISGKTCYDLPQKEIHLMSTGIHSAVTGPDLGLTLIKKREEPLDHKRVTGSKEGSGPETEIDFIDRDYLDRAGDLSSDSETSAPLPQRHHQYNGISMCNGSSNGFNRDKDDSGSGNSSGAEEEEELAILEAFSFGLAPPESPETQARRAARRELDEKDKLIAGIRKWDKWGTSDACGVATTLYEQHPTLKIHAGDPIADSFGIVARENSAILCLADGVNWGERSRRASRCAVHGCVDYLNRALYSSAGAVENTMDIFVCLLRAFHAAHELILKEGAFLTTLCTAVVAQLKESNKFIVCTCNVGDTLAYVYSEKHGVREVTQGSHDIFSNRDMRDALGALGPVDGTSPELSNLTVAMTICDEGDIVFLASDGVTDNFDPVVGKFTLAQRKSPIPVDPVPQPAAQINSRGNSPAGQSNGNTPSPQNDKKANPIQQGLRNMKVRRSNSNPDRGAAASAAALAARRRAQAHALPMVTAQQRHELTLLRMEDLLRHGIADDTGRIKSYSFPCRTASQLVDLLVLFSRKITAAKRRILEDPDLYDLSSPEEAKDSLFMDDRPKVTFGEQEQRARRRRVADKLAQVPGKLDHASVVAYKVGFYGKMRGAGFRYSNNVSRKTNSTSSTSNLVMNGKQDHNLRLKPRLARFESQDEIDLIICTDELSSSATVAVEPGKDYRESLI